MLHHRRSILSPPSISADFVHLDASGMSREAMVPNPLINGYPQNPYVHGQRKTQFDELRPSMEESEHMPRRIHGFPKDDASVVATDISGPTAATAPPTNQPSPVKKPLKSALKRSKPAVPADAASLASVPSKPSSQPSIELRRESSDLKGNASDAPPPASNKRFMDLDSLFVPHTARLQNGSLDQDEKPVQRAGDAHDDDEVKRAKEEVQRLRELLSAVDANKSDAGDEMCSNPQDVSVNDEHENKRSRRSSDKGKGKGESPLGSKSSKKKGKKVRKSGSESQEDEDGKHSEKPGEGDGDVEISGFQFPDIGKAHNCLHSGRGCVLAHLKHITQTC
jgi:hypothetical protein